MKSRRTCLAPEAPPVPPGKRRAMDIASLIGVIVGCICLGIVGMETSHGHWAMFYSLEGVLMVFGGSISVCFMSMPMEKVKAVTGFLKRFMFNKSRPAAEVIKLL